MMSKQFHNRKKLEPNRKHLRKNLTPAEAFLWNYLKNKQLYGLKFRRQHSMGNFIVDFYCARHRLIIELDGQYHNEVLQIEKDEKRDDYLSSLSFTILGYENKYVFEELEHVLNDIKTHCKID